VELNDPGSTAVGKPIRVLAAWGVPGKVAKLGDITLYSWTFLTESSRSGTSYSGRVDESGNVRLQERGKTTERGCEITVEVNEEGIIERTSVRKINLGFGFCTPPAEWWKESK
jgi:hypothetical protein